MAKRARTTRRRRARANRPAPATSGTEALPQEQRTEPAVTAADLRIIARAFALIALRLSDSRGKTLGERARLLQSMGLSVSDVAGLLGSTPRSIGELLWRARRPQRRQGRRRG